MASLDKRLEHLEQACIEGEEHSPKVLPYDPLTVPQEREARDDFFRSARPDAEGPVFFIPDNGRDSNAPPGE